MNKYDFISELSKDGSAILSTHYDQKIKMSVFDAIALLASGFSDCSYCNDECPSWGIDNDLIGIDPVVLMYHAPTEEETIPPWSVFIYGSGEDCKTFYTVEHAIAYYVKLNKKNIERLIEGYKYES